MGDIEAALDAPGGAGRVALARSGQVAGFLAARRIEGTAWTLDRITVLPAIGTRG